MHLADAAHLAILLAAIADECAYKVHTMQAFSHCFMELLISPGYKIIGYLIQEATLRTNWNVRVLKLSQINILNKFANITKSLFLKSFFEILHILIEVILSHLYSSATIDV